ncbi:MAG: N5-glutamine methyltransferase family protein [Candidatus Dojkabacteria bacterium]
MEFVEIFNQLNFLNDSLRLQYTNYIYKHAVDSFDEAAMLQVVSRLRGGEPIEYIFNSAEFFGYQFYVDTRCLIPRIETERLVSECVSYMRNGEESDYTVIDVGTGSGCVIFSIANNIMSQPTSSARSIRFIGIDTARDALEVAALNAHNFQLNTIVELKECSFQDFDFAKYPNIIVCSNLPYISAGEYVQESVLHYEPHEALFAGLKGNELNEALREKLVPLSNIRMLVMEKSKGKVETYIAR